MIPYAKHSVTADDINAVLSVLCSDRLTQGPTVPKLEAALAEKCGAKYAVAVSSGTAALHLAYLACGVGPGTTVLTSPVSFVATANAVLYCGADVEFRHEGALWESDVVVPIDLGGDPCIMASESTVIRDACHSLHFNPDTDMAACFSFHPCKHIAAGEGGAIVTNDFTIDEKCRALRDHGRYMTAKGKWQTATPVGMQMYDMGFNYRLAEIPAALALSQLKRLDTNIAERRRIAALYDSAFKGVPVQHSPQSARHLYQILVDDRDNVRQELAKRGVGTQVHYEPIIPLQPYYKDRFGYREGMWPNAEAFAARTLSIPLYPTMTEEDITHVIQGVSNVVG